jgi:hypothetical protein
LSTRSTALHYFSLPATLGKHFFGVGHGEFFSFESRSITYLRTESIRTRRGEKKISKEMKGKERVEI